MTLIHEHPGLQTTANQGRTLLDGQQAPEKSRTVDFHEADDAARERAAAVIGRHCDTGHRVNFGYGPLVAVAAWDVERQCRQGASACASE